MQSANHARRVPGSRFRSSLLFIRRDLDQGWRLSCCAHIEADCVVEVPRLMTSPKAATLGYGRHVILDPHTHKLHLQLSPPDLNDQRSDWQRLREKLKDEGYEVRADLNLIRSLPATLRANDFSITAVIGGDELIAVDSGDTADSCLGIAVDVGTTTVVVALIDLNTAPHSAHYPHSTAKPLSARM